VAMDLLQGRLLENLSMLARDAVGAPSGLSRGKTSAPCGERVGNWRSGPRGRSALQTSLTSVRCYGNVLRLTSYLFFRGYFGKPDPGAKEAAAGPASAV
jgi:hypothetical protein